MSAAPAGADLGALLARSSIVVCCGTGGVGKTTTAAALALEAARRGRRAVVVTIDPARRLADALGLDALTNTPSRVAGPWDGELWALMLDTRATFDELIAAHAASPEQARRILANVFYRNIAGALSGTQEYMAMEKLHQLATSDAFDLVVVDTPPTRRALDFLEAPARLGRFLDHRLYRTLVAPARGYLRLANLAAGAFVRTVSQVVGGAVVADAVAFFQAFDGMEEGFRRRAEEVRRELGAPGTAFVLVASPRADTVAEATWFAGALADADLRVAALVVNRAQPRFGPGGDPTGGPAGDAPDDAAAGAGAALAELRANLAELDRAVAGQEATLAGLAAGLGGAPVVRVPLLAREVHDLAGLDEVAGHLFAR